MKVTFKKIEDQCTAKLRSFSPVLGQNPLTEFEYFCEKLEEFKVSHPMEFSLLKSALKAFKKRGVETRYLKPEGKAWYLPNVFSSVKKKNKNDFGLRLYLLFIRYDLIVLLNGGKKTKHKPSECPNVKEHCERAMKLANIVHKAFDDDFLLEEDENPFQDFELEI